MKSLDCHQRPDIFLVVSDQSRVSNGDSLLPLVDHLLDMPPDPLWTKLWRRMWLRQETGLLKLLTTCLMPEPSLASRLHFAGVDCMFSATEFGPRFSVPLLSWITDFQHRHLPEMFSAEEIQYRDKQFSRIANYADRVLLSSQSARRDFEEFAKESAHKARVLPFVAQVPIDLYDSDPGWVYDKYHLPRRFIYLPNQFWKHKNHEAVIQALAIAKTRCPEIVVVSTGNVWDGRHPLYFAELLASISRMDLRDNLLLLGMVPYDHLFHLMRQSMAVLQPSFFEGWSTTVEEAKSVGKRMILSDISVHREQDPPKAVFFDPNDPSALADCLLEAFGDWIPGPDRELEELSRQQLPERTRRFGQSFVEIAEEVVSI